MYINENEIKSIFLAQKTFFATGASQNIEFKKDTLAKLRKAILEYQDEICDSLNKDLGKSKEFVEKAEIGSTLAEIDNAIQNIDSWVIPEKIDNFDKFNDSLESEAYIEHEAYGVSYIIGPFNYPIALIFKPLVGAIVGGNTAIIKPSETTPNTSKVIEKLIKSTFSNQHICVIQGSVKENTYLLSLPFDFIFFTGSPSTGRIVMKAASQNLTPVILELGGKSPMIVLPDANIDLVVDQIIYGKCSNSGQTCVAPDYMIVHESIKNKILESLIKKYKEKQFSIDSNGKIVTQEQTRKIKNLLEKTKGNIVFGGSVDVEQRYVQSTIVDSVQWDDSLMQQELFAPILPILTFNEIKVMIDDINNNHPKPLAAYIFSSDIDQSKYILSKIQSGDAMINAVVSHVSSHHLPFGGVGNSGMGEYHGYYSYLAFTHRKSLVISKPVSSAFNK